MLCFLMLCFLMLCFLVLGVLLLWLRWPALPAGASTTLVTRRP
jgi:hypothetical protein